MQANTQNNSGGAGQQVDNQNSQSLPPIQNANSSNGGGEQQSTDANQAGKTIERKKKQRKQKMPKLIFNLMYTVYPLIKKVAKELGYRVRTDDI